MSKKKIIMLIIAVLVVLGIAGTALGGSKDDKKPIANAGDKKEDKKEYGLNEPVMLGKQQITVKEVTKSAGNEYDKPKDGMEYVIVLIEIVNKGDDDESYNPLYFKVKNSQGQKEGMTLSAVNNDTALKAGELSTGGTVSGTIVFEEPINDSKLSLIYQPLASRDKIEINLQ